MSSEKLTHEECVRREGEARLKAASPTSLEAKREYLELAEMWDGLCKAMKNHGLTGIPNISEPEPKSPH